MSWSHIYEFKWNPSIAILFDISLLVTFMYVLIYVCIYNGMCVHPKPLLRAAIIKLSECTSKSVCTESFKNPTQMCLILKIRNMYVTIRDALIVPDALNI